MNKGYFLLCITMKHLNLFVFSNIFIAFAAASMTLQVCMLLNVPGYTFFGLAFFGTLVLYNFHRLYRFRNTRRAAAPRYQWIVKHRVWLIFLVLVGIVGGVILLQHLSKWSFTFLAALVFFGLGYVVECFGKQKKALRDLPGLKIFVVAMVWAGFLVALPAIEHQIKPFPWVLMLEKFLFIFAITLPFDMRDVAVDAPSQKTLPQVLGIKNASYLGVFSCLMCICLAAYQWHDNLVSIGYLITQTLTYILAVWCLLLAQKKRNELFYSFLIDGLILLAACLSYPFI